MNIKPSLLAVAIAMATQSAFALQTLETTSVDGNDKKAQSTTDARVSEDEGASIVTAEDIEQRQATSLEDALAGNAGVVIEETTNGGSEITIRGLSSDNVSVRVEGAPNNRRLTSHRTTDSAGDTVWLNMDMYESVTVIPGAAANTYGSGSTGGVVLLETKDPESVLRGDDFAANLRYTYTTNGQGNRISGDVAKQFGDVFALNATLSTSSVEPAEDANGKQLTDNDETTDDLSYLIKGVITPTQSQRIELSVMNDKTEYAANTPDTLEKFRVEDRTFAAQYGYNPQDNDWVDFKARVSRANNERESDEQTGDWTSTGSVETTYAEIENTTVLGAESSMTHRLRYGADYTLDDVDFQNGYTFNGVRLSSTRKQIGGYLTDTISFGDALKVSGSLRYDTYSADGFGADVDGKSSFNSKLSAVWHPLEGTAAKGLGFIALIGSGYKVPQLFDLYGKHKVKVFQATDNGDGTFTTDDISPCLDTDSSNKGSGTCFLPNPDLQGESSLSREIGFTFDRDDLVVDGDRLSTRVNYFHTDLKDQITTETVGTVTYDGTTYDVNQSVNRDEAAVFGWEIEASYDSRGLFGHFSMQDIAGYSVNDDDSHTKDTSLVPRIISTSIGTFFADQKGRVGIDGKYRQGRSYSSTSRGVTSEYVYRSYYVYDLFASWQFTENLGVQARIDNVTDVAYSNSSKAEDADTGEDTTAYKAGRNAKLSVAYRF